MKTSEELFDELKSIRKDAAESIVNILKSHDNKANFMIDEEGKTIDDEDFDSDFEYENRVWTECYGKYGNETGYITMVELGKDDAIIITAEGEDTTYDTDFVCHSTPVYLDILERFEFMEKYNLFKD